MTTYSCRLSMIHLWICALSVISCSFNGHQRHEPTNVTTTNTPSSILNKPIVPKLYLEHSGSMFGYDGPKVNGNFKNTIVQLLNQFDNPASTSIFIVNDKVYPYPKSYNNLIRSTTLFQDQIGKRDYTDFGQIFQTIASEIQENQLAVLTTDLIYSDQSASSQNASKIMATAQNLAHIALKNYAKTGSVLVLKLNSEYKGKYYSFNSPNVGRPYSGNRPYYILLFAKNTTMTRFLTATQYASLRDFSAYPGFENQQFFGSDKQTHAPYYTLVESDPEAKGSFNKDRKGDNTNGLHSIKGVSPPHRSNEKLTLVVAANLPNSAYGNDFIQNPANYEVESIKDQFKIKYIKPSAYPGTTHKIILEATNVTSGERTVNIRLKRLFPLDWVKKSTTDTDTDFSLRTFSTTTFGLLPMLMGIQQAYDAHIIDKKYLCSLSIYLKD